MIKTEMNGKAVYSDGSQVEKEMLEIAAGHPETSAGDYIAGDSRYTVNNTFSPVRNNILNWYPFRPGCSILEVGAGMGAVTGLLCDKAARVVSVEMNRNRADVIRARYPQRQNLTVMSADINEWETDERFDYVVLIGVLEYAGVFMDGADPYLRFISRLKSFLKDDGVLLLAIENQFGLKYWLGASEDHLQKPYAGIRGYEEKGTPRTFSKHALQEMIRRAGFADQRMYYLLPDYKFPVAVYTDEWLPDYYDIQNITFYYSRNSALTARENSVYKGILENGTFDFFANSFLAEASSSLPEQHIIRVQGRGECKPEYRIITTIDNHGNVTKSAADLRAERHIRNTYEIGEILKSRGIRYIDQELQGTRIVTKQQTLPSANRIMQEALREGDEQKAFHMIDLLKKNLLKSNSLEEGSVSGSGETVLQDVFMDMNFCNAFYDGSLDEMIFYDQEWCFTGLSLQFQLYYAIKLSFDRLDGEPMIPREKLYAYAGISEERTDEYDRIETSVWAKVSNRGTDVYGADGYYNTYSDELTLERQNYRRQQIIEELTENNNVLAAESHNKDAHIEQLIVSERILKSAVENRDARIDQLSERERKLEAEQEGLKKQLGEAQTELVNKQGHIDLLLESDRELDRIHRSRSWRFMSKCWKVRDWLIPLNSKRRLFLKLIVKFVRNPVRCLKKVDRDHIRKFSNGVKSGAISSVSASLDSCLGTVSVTTERPDQYPVTEYERIEDVPKLHVPESADPKVSIIIPVYNQFAYTYACLKSIAMNSGDVAYEVILADDCSDDLTTEIEKAVSGIRVVRNKKNLRFLLNCNHAAEQAKGEYILFLNNDTQVMKDWLQPLVSLIERDPKTGMVGSKLIYPDGRLQEAGGILWQDGSAWNFGHLDDPAKPEYNYVKEVDYISGAAIMIRADLWRQLKGFDEHFAPAYCEDSDLAFRVRDAGCKVLYQPQSVVIHFEGISNGTDISEGQKSYQKVNTKKFYKKWKEVLEKEHNPNGENSFLARDRSLHRKTMLFVDHYVPQYDKDAGSRTVYAYIRMFVRAGYNIKFIGDNFFPHQPYTSVLQQMGVEVLFGNWYAQHWKEWLTENANSIDYAFLNRPHIAVKYIDLIREKTNAKILYYGHDLHFLRCSREYEVTGDKKMLSEAENWKEKEISLMLKADITTYPSETEIEEIHRLNPDIHAMAIPAYIFDDTDPSEYSLSERNDLFFIGGYAHSPNVDAVKWFVGEILPIVCRTIQNIRIHIAGSNMPQDLMELASDHVVIDGMLTDEQLEEFYHKVRLNVVPLRYGAGIKGKIVESMRYGLPVITTPCGAEGIIGAECVLRVGSTAEEIAQQIISVYNDEKELHRMSEEGKKYVLLHYSEKEALAVMRKVFDLPVEETR